MVETMNQPQGPEDDIDLIHALDRIARFLSVSQKTLILAAFAGLLCGFIIYLSLPKSYGSTLILHSQILTNSEEIEILESWNRLRRNGEYKVLSANMNCQPALLQKVNYIGAANIAISQPSSGFTIEVYVKDTSILADLQKAIIHGLEENEYVRQKVEFKRNSTLQMIDNINQEIGRLDSTKNLIQSNAVGRGTGSGLMLNISDVNVQKVTLTEKLFQYKEALRFVDAIQVLQNFEKYARPSSPRLSILMLSGLLGGLFLGFVLALFKVVKAKIAILRQLKIASANRDTI